MKTYLLSLCWVVACLIPAHGQEIQSSSLAKAEKVATFVKHLQATFTLGTGSNPINGLQARQLRQISLGQLGLSYKLGSRLSIGLSTTGTLGNCQAGYTSSEGGFVSFGNLSDDDDDGPDDLDDPNDLDDLNDMDDDEDCDDDEFSNVLATITLILSDKVPIFIQAAGGYSFSQGAPAYTALVGYHQKLVGGLGLVGGIRFSDVLYKVPADAISVTPSNGLKAELGLSWNF